MRVTVWGENVHEKHNEAVAALYPEGIHGQIAALLREGIAGAEVRTATLEEPAHGLPDDVLADTDVLTWWGHLAHQMVDDEIVEKIATRVHDGMGLIVLHSAHMSKILRRLLGTRCTLRWREADDREVIWTVLPTHPIAAGVRQPIILDRHEMYGEFFDIPVPDELVFVSSFTGGEVFRSGCCFSRGKGRIFYFSPGHETYPIYYQEPIARVLCNAVEWAYTEAPSTIPTADCPNPEVGWFESDGAT